MLKDAARVAVQKSPLLRDISGDDDGPCGFCPTLNDKGKHLLNHKMVTWLSASIAQWLESGTSVRVIASSNPAQTEMASTVVRSYIGLVPFSKRRKTNGSLKKNGYMHSSIITSVGN